jgi:hypothetical protein
LVRSKRFVHLVEEEYQALDGDDEMLGFGAFLDHVAPALAFERIGYLFEHLLPELAALDVLVAKRNAEAQDGDRGIVDILVELFRPQPHAGPIVGIFRCKRRIGIGVVEIFENDVRFRNDLVAVEERGHYCAAVELAIPGLLMLPRAQDEMAALPFESFLRETDPHLLRAERHVIVIEHQHCSLPYRLRSGIGVHTTSSMWPTPVASMTRRSNPSAIPQASGIAASASRKSSSIG